MITYYSDFLSGNRLKRCYDLAPPRVCQYLNEEVNFVRQRIKPADLVLELGCGYGRVLRELSSKPALLVGIDNSLKSLQYGRNIFLKSDKMVLICMGADKLGFSDNTFDLVFCIQNGISALGIEPKLLVQEALRITKQNGKLILSSYSNKFWEDRLKWFQIQSEHGLVGEIDYNLTRKGMIICKDGFKANNEEVIGDTFKSETLMRALIDYEYIGKKNRYLCGDSTFPEEIDIIHIHSIQKLD